MNGIITENDNIIRSTTTSLKLSNKSKLIKLNEFINEYVKIVSTFINLIWDVENIPSMLPKQYTDKVETWLSARAIQAAAKQAASIVRGTKKKQKQRLYVIEKLKKEGKFAKARKLQAIYNKNIASKPNLNSINPELDTRFFKLDFNKTTSFDGWLNLTSLGFDRKDKIKFPFKFHKHFLELSKNGKLLNSIRISKDSLTLNFELEKPKIKKEGKTLGIDIGKTTTLTTSKGQSLDKDIHGHDYTTICTKLAHKKKGSKGFLRAQKHRSNYLKWIVKQLDLNGVKQVNLERVKRFPKGKSRHMKHWNFGEFSDVLEEHFMKQGVLVNRVNPTYTSQRCSQCGWVRKSNRRGKLFKCKACAFTCDADLNGSINIGFDLRPIGARERLLNKNRKGFYWCEKGQELIVPDATKDISKKEILT